MTFFYILTTCDFLRCFRAADYSFLNSADRRVHTYTISKVLRCLYNIRRTGYLSCINALFISIVSDTTVTVPHQLRLSFWAVHHLHRRRPEPTITYPVTALPRRAKPSRVFRLRRAFSRRRNCGAGNRRTSVCAAASRAPQPRRDRRRRANSTSVGVAVNV